MVTPPSPSLVTVYWRPGCPYCARLRRGLRRVGLATTEVNIWEDPGAAATVRTFAGGNETVPTVVVGDIGLVNPSVPAILDVVSQVAPDLVPDRQVLVAARPWPALRVAQWIAVIGIAVASLLADAAGHAGTSWALDAVALVVYLGFRIGRRQSDSGSRARSTHRGRT